jgi:hypothetical protein
LGVILISIFERKNIVAIISVFAVISGKENVPTFKQGLILTLNPTARYRTGYQFSILFRHFSFHLFSILMKKFTYNNNTNNSHTKIDKRINAIRPISVSLTSKLSMVGTTICAKTNWAHHVKK